MSIAIMQPYFFPYIGYWQLMDAVDTFVILDDVNYIPRGWMHRNRICVDGKERYLTNPVRKASQNRIIRDMEFVGDRQTMENLLTTVRYAFRDAPCYAAVDPLVSETLLFPDGNLTNYLEHSLREVSAFLGISVQMIRSSSLRERREGSKQEAIISLCKTAGCDIYYNLSGGQSLYHKEDFERNGMELRFVKPDFPAIWEYIEEEHPDYSILQLMAYHEPAVLADLLNYRVVF